MLNVVRSVRLILEAIADVHALQTATIPSSASVGSRTPPSSRPNSSPPTPTEENVPKITAEHLKLRLRLLPLLQVEEVLIRKLIPAGSPDFETSHLAHITNVPVDSLKEREVTVNSHFAWKNMFNRMLGQRSSIDSQSIDWDDPDVGIYSAYNAELCIGPDGFPGPGKDHPCVRGRYDSAVAGSHHPSRPRVPEAEVAGYAGLVRLPPCIVASHHTH